MKSLSKYLGAVGVVALVLCVLPAHAKIWRLNNNSAVNPAIGADFTGTLQQAHDNASVVSGDTIHIEQSPTTYGPCTFTKKLVLIGSGYFLADNPQTQVNTANNSKVASLTFLNANSASSSVWGLTTDGITAAVSNLTIGRCYFLNSRLTLGTSTDPITGVKIIGNFFSAYANQAVVAPNGTPAAGNVVDFYDNIIYSNWGASAGFYLPTNFSGIIKNNTFCSPPGYTMNVSNYYIVNNILHGAQPTYNNCVVEYNIATNVNQTTGAAGTGNTFSNNTVTSPNTWAAIGTVGGAGSLTIDKHYVLLASSPALTAGKPLTTGGAGTQCGAFAGDYPYVLSGLPPVPNIYVFDIQSIPAGATTINATVTAKSNN